MHEVRVVFSKTGPAAYLSHLDVMRTFARSFLRAGISLRHTEGFNPHPYLSIAHPLPVGITSGCEILDCEVLGDDFDRFMDRINSSLPAGLEVTSVSAPLKRISDIAYAEYNATFFYDDKIPHDAIERLASFFSSPEISVEKKSKRGTVTVNLADHLNRIEFARVSGSEVAAKLILRAGESLLNPRYVASAISEPDLRPVFSKYHRAAFFDHDMNLFL